MEFAPELLNLRPELCDLLTELVVAGLVSIIVALLFVITMKIASQPIQFVSQLVDIVHERNSYESSRGTLHLRSNPSSRQSLNRSKS